MPVSKATNTVAGEALIGGLTVQQYSIRVPLTLPVMRTLACSHVSSSSTYRYYYFAEAHGLTTNDIIWPGGFSDANFNPETDHQHFQVKVVGADYIGVQKAASYSLSKTAVAAGGVVVQGFTALRMGLRFRLTAQAGFTATDQMFVMGLSTGAYPVSSASCAGFSGHATRGGTVTYNSGTGRLSLTQSNNAFSSKYGNTWQATYSAYNTSFSASRDHPEVRVIDVIKASSSNNYLQTTRGICTTAGITRAQFIAALRFPEAMNNAEKTLGGLYFSNFYAASENAQNQTAFKYAASPSLYLEVASRDPSCGIEVFDIGYTYW